MTDEYPYAEAIVIIAGIPVTLAASPGIGSGIGGTPHGLP